jgi:hypothetical protein
VGGVSDHRAESGHAGMAGETRREHEDARDQQHRRRRGAHAAVRLRGGLRGRRAAGPHGHAARLDQRAAPTTLPADLLAPLHRTAARLGRPVGAATLEAAAAAAPSHPFAAIRPALRTATGLRLADRPHAATRNQSQRAERRGEAGASEREVPEASVRHGLDRTPPEAVPEAFAASGSRLQPEADQCHYHEQAGQDRQHAEQPPANRAGGRAKRDRQGDRPAHACQQQCEIEEAPTQVEGRDDERRVLEHLRGDTRRLRPGLRHVEDPRALDRVGVG